MGIVMKETENGNRFILYCDTCERSHLYTYDPNSQWGEVVTIDGDCKRERKQDRQRARLMGARDILFN